MREKARTRAEMDLFIMGRVARELSRLSVAGRKMAAAWLAEVAICPESLDPASGQDERGSQADMFAEGGAAS